MFCWCTGSFHIASFYAAVAGIVAVKHSGDHGQVTCEVEQAFRFIPKLMSFPLKVRRFASFAVVSRRHLD